MQSDLKFLPLNTRAPPSMTSSALDFFTDRENWSCQLFVLPCQATINCWRAYVFLKPKEFVRALRMLEPGVSSTTDRVSSCGQT